MKKVRQELQVAFAFFVGIAFSILFLISTENSLISGDIAVLVGVELLSISALIVAFLHYKGSMIAHQETWELHIFEKGFKAAMEEERRTEDALSNLSNKHKQEIESLTHEQKQLFEAALISIDKRYKDQISTYKELLLLFASGDASPGEADSIKALLLKATDDSYERGYDNGYADGKKGLKPQTNQKK